MSVNSVTKFINCNKILKTNQSPYPFIIMNTPVNNNVNFSKKDNKINFVTVTFSVDAYKKLKENELNALTETARDLFHTLAEFAKYNSMTNEVKLLCVDDELQKLNTDSCGNYQVHFYKNLFDPFKSIKIQPHNKLTKKTTDILLHEIFTLDLDENERRVEEF